jgi:hypothetical protein
MNVQTITDPKLRTAFRLRRAADLVDGVEGVCFHYLDAIEAVFVTAKKRQEIRYLVESTYHFEAETFEDPGYEAAAVILRDLADGLDPEGVA